MLHSISLISYLTLGTFVLTLLPFSPEKSLLSEIAVFLTVLVTINQAYDCCSIENPNCGYLPSFLLPLYLLHIGTHCPDSLSGMSLLFLCLFFFFSLTGSYSSHFIYWVIVLPFWIHFWPVLSMCGFSVSSSAPDGCY